MRDDVEEKRSSNRCETLLAFLVRKAGFLWWPHAKMNVKWRVYYFTRLHKLVDSYVDFAGVTNILNHFTCKFTLKEHLRTNLMHRKRWALSRHSRWPTKLRTF